MNKILASITILACLSCSAIQKRIASNQQNSFQEYNEKMIKESEEREKQKRARANELFEAHMAEQQKQRETLKREDYCRAPWSSHEFNLMRQQDNQKPFEELPDHSDNLNKPNPYLKKWKDAEEKYKEKIANGCKPSDSENEFRESLAYLVSKEEKRIAELDRRAKIQEEIRKENERILQEIRDQQAKELAYWEKQAEKRGLTFVQTSLTQVLNGIRSGNISISEAKKYAIERGDLDSSFKVLQVLGNGSALLVNNDYDFKVIIKNVKVPVYEGSNLLQIPLDALVITGTTRYNATFGTNQAFVVKPAW